RVPGRSEVLSQSSVALACVSAELREPCPIPHLLRGLKRLLRRSYRGSGLGELRRQMLHTLAGIFAREVLRSGQLGQRVMPRHLSPGCIEIACDRVGRLLARGLQPGCFRTRRVGLLADLALRNFHYRLSSRDVMPLPCRRAEPANP